MKIKLSLDDLCWLASGASKWSVPVVSLMYLSGCQMGNRGSHDGYAMVIMGLIVFVAGIISEKASVALVGVALWFIG